MKHFNTLFFRTSKHLTWLAIASAIAIGSTSAWAHTKTKTAHKTSKATSAAKARTHKTAATNSSHSSKIAVRGDFIVAVVNTEAITNQEVHNQARLITEQIRAGIAPPLPNEQALLQQALKQLIFKRAAIQTARANGLALSDEEIDMAEAQLARLAETSPQQYRKRIMAERHISLAAYRKELGDQILLERMRDARMREAASKVTEQDARQWLQQQRPQQAPATRASLLNLAQIIVAVPSDATPQQQEELHERAKEALRKVQNGTDFAQVVRDYTDGFGRDTGGVIGLRDQAQYPTEFLQATADIAIGQNTGLVRSSAGWHILKVIDRQQPADSGLVQTEHHVRHILLRPNANLSPMQAAHRLTDLRNRIVSGKIDFASAARQYSHDGSASKGGDLGWTGPGVFVPEFEEALHQLQPGQISQPVSSRFGVHLIQLLNRKATPLTQQQELAVARRILGEQKSSQALQEWESDLLHHTYVEMREQPR